MTNITVLYLRAQQGKEPGINSVKLAAGCEGRMTNISVLYFKDTTGHHVF